MEEREKTKIGETEYLNENCWLVKTLNYAPYKRCQYCELKFPNCLFLHYQLISLILISFFLVLSFVIDGNISELVIVFIFTLVVVYGYFFARSTDKIIKSNFTRIKAEASVLREKISREVAEKLAARESALREGAEKIAIREGALRQRAEKIAVQYQQLNETRNNMFLVGHHHARTPLANIKNLSALLLEEGYGPVNKEQKWALQNIFNKAQESIDLANLYLKVSELEVGKATISKEATELKKIVNDQIKKLSFDAKLNKVEIKKDFENNFPEVFVDREKIALAFYALIDNSLKYVPQKTGKIIVGLKRSGVEKILFSCRDNGIGIEKERVENLGKIAFQRSNHAQGINVTGKGLALYLSNLIVKAHKGRLWAESEGKGKGAIFYVELPLK